MIDREHRFSRGTACATVLSCGLPICGCKPHSNRGSGSNKLFFPDGIAFDGNGFVGAAVTAPAFNYLRGIEDGNEEVVDLTGVEPLAACG